MREKPLAETGHSKKRLLWCEYTLQVDNEAAHGIYRDTNGVMPAPVSLLRFRHPNRELVLENFNGDKQEQHKQEYKKGDCEEQGKTKAPDQQVIRSRKTKSIL